MAVPSQIASHTVALPESECTFMPAIAWSRPIFVTVLSIVLTHGLFRVHVVTRTLCASVPLKNTSSCAQAGVLFGRAILTRFPSCVHRRHPHSPPRSAHSCRFLNRSPRVYGWDTWSMGQPITNSYRRHQLWQQILHCCPNLHQTTEPHTPSRGSVTLMTHRALHNPPQRRIVAQQMLSHQRITHLAVWRTLFCHPRVTHPTATHPMVTHFTVTHQTVTQHTMTRQIWVREGAGSLVAVLMPQSGRLGQFQG